MRKVLYLFSKFSDQDIDWLVGAGTGENVEKGSLLIREGHHVENLFITLSGTFAVKRNNVNIATSGAGEVLGELSFLDSRPPAASVYALEDGIVLKIPVTRLRSKLRVDHPFAGRFYFALGVMLADRMRETVQQLAYGPTRTLDESTEEFGEISPDLLDETGLAAARFDRLRTAVLHAENHGLMKNQVYTAAG